MIFEVYKEYIKKFSSIEKAIEDGYCVKWDTERITGAFSNGSGTMKDLKKYMEANKKLCVFIER